MMNCREATRLLSAAQEQPLPWRLRLAVRLHTLMCAGCRRFARQLQTLRAAMRIFATGDGHDDTRD